MVLHRSRAYKEVAGDLCVAVAFRKQVKHLALARRERLVHIQRRGLGFFEVGFDRALRKRLAKVAPSDGGSLLLISTLPRPTSMGMDATLDAKEFLDLLGMVEAAL